MKAFVTNSVAAAAAIARPPNGRGSKWKPTTSPRLAAPIPLRKLRRSVRVSMIVMSALQSLCRFVDGRADPVVGRAAADISAHGRIDIGVGRFRSLLQKRRRRHQLPGLAITALRHVERDPGRAEGFRLTARDAFDGYDFTAFEG